MHRARFYVPTVISFFEDGSLDRDGNRAIAEFLIDGGVDGLLVMGSTGEFYSMTMDQKKQMILDSVKNVNGRADLLIGTNCMRTADTIELSRFALEAGANGVMIIGPYYFSMDPGSLEDYYDSLCDNIPGPVYLYNFPERTGYDLPVELVPRLREKHANLKGIKDSHSQFSHTRRIIDAVCGEYPDFEVFSGFDENLFHIMLNGGVGCIGGMGNIFPEICARSVKAANEGDLKAMETCQKLLNEMSELYSFSTNFIPLCKEAMAQRGVKLQTCCLHPMRSADATMKDKLASYIERIEKTYTAIR